MANEPANAFDLTSRWLVEATIEEVADILGDVASLPSWWSEVYLDVQVLEAGDTDGLGRLFQIHSRGWLPYTLRWTGRVVEARPPHGWTIEATGDLVGRGVWTLRQDGAVADIFYDWRVQAEKPVLRRLSPVLKPLFAANHRWAMARGLDGLKRELARRRH